MMRGIRLPINRGYPAKNFSLRGASVILKQFCSLINFTTKHNTYKFNIHFKTIPEHLNIEWTGFKSGSS
jgi:hypothetical protein